MIGSPLVLRRRPRLPSRHGFIERNTVWVPRLNQLVAVVEMETIQEAGGRRRRHNPSPEPVQPLALAANSLQFLWNGVMAAVISRDELTSGKPWARFKAHGDPFPLAPSWVETDLKLGGAGCMDSSFAEQPRIACTEFRF